MSYSSYIFFISIYIFMSFMFMVSYVKYFCIIVFLKFSNKIKLEKFGAFLSEYQRVGQFLIDEIWDNGYGEFNIKKDVLDIPKYIDYKQFKIETPLSARALSSLATQIAGVISASTEKRRRKLWLFDKRLAHL